MSNYQAGPGIISELGREVQIDVALLDVPAERISQISVTNIERVEELVERNVHGITHFPVQVVDGLSNILDVGDEISP